MNWNSAPSIRVKNVSGSEIPARSFVKLNGNSGGTHFEHYVEVDQPDGTEGDYYLVTGPHAIANTKIGIAYFPFAPVKVKHSSVPAYVEEVGPASGSWEADPDGTGFAALKRDGDYSFIVSLGGSGGGTCSKVVKIWYVGNELPTGGSVTVPMTYDGNSGSPSWAYDADQPTVEAAIAGAITGLSTSDITVLFGQSATAGKAFGNWPITIAFPDVTLWAQNGDITDTFTFVSGTVPHVVLGDICCNE